MLLLTCSDGNDPIKEIETKDPFITLKKTNIDFTNEGGSDAILIESNVTWTAKSSASWCTVSPSSGNKSTESITLSVPAYMEYDNRSCTITIESGGISKTVTVSQSQEDAIILSEKDFDLSSKAQSVEVEVKTNIDHEIIIPEDAKHWVTYTATRALRTETVVLDIAENKDYDGRTVEVIIKDKKTDLQEIVTIKQAANTGLIISEDKYELTNDGGTIEVEVKANVEFDIEIADKWITRVETRGLTTTNLIFDIAENMSYENRQGVITINQKNGDLSSTIKVHQSKRDKWEDQNRAAFNKIAASSEYQTIQSESKNGSIAYKVIKNGDGVSPLYTDRVRVLYTGWFKRVDWNKGDTFINEDGVKVQNKYIFDSTANRNDVPSVFQVSGVIDGFSTALQHMKVGEKWEVWMPAELGYGATSQSSIPTNTTLVFEIELLEVL